MTDIFISARQAHDLHLRDIYMAFTGLGDQILLLAAAEQHYKKTSKKIFLACQYRQLAHNADFCLVLDLPDSCGVEKLYAEQFTAYKKRGGGNKVEINGVEFTLKLISYLNFGINRNGRLIRRWPDNHILARMCERMGLSGEIEIAPRLALSNLEEKFGKFSDKRQISIMTGGQAHHKYFLPKIAQKIVDALHPEYDFVQIGGKDDPPLTNTLHLMGKLPLHKTSAVLSNSALFAGSIGGLMHLARAVDCPSVIAFAGEPLSFEFYNTNSYVFSDTPCSECPDGRLDPFHEPCPYAYRCITNINPDKMIAMLKEKLAAPPVSLPPQTVILSPDPVIGMEDWHRLRYVALLHQRHKEPFGFFGRTPPVCGLQ